MCRGEVVVVSAFEIGGDRGRIVRPSGQSIDRRAVGRCDSTGCDSGGATFVPMSPPTSGIATIRPASGAWMGRDSGVSFCKLRCVRLREFSQVLRQAGFTENDHVIQALPPNGADRAFDVRTLPVKRGRSWPPSPATARPPPTGAPLLWMPSWAWRGRWAALRRWLPRGRLSLQLV